MSTEETPILFFSFVDVRGRTWIPYREHDKWHIRGEVRTLREIGALCGIDEETLTILAIKYGN